MRDVRIPRSLVVTIVVAAAFLSAKHQSQPTLDRRRLAAAADEHGAAKLDDAFVYDVVTRFNESLIANIDAIDTAVRAVLAGNVAIVVFAIDKIRELHHAEECWAIGLLAGSLIACVSAYVIGFPFGANDRDGTVPTRFVLDFVASRDAAISSAIEAVTQAGLKNVVLRLWKRALVVAAIVLLLAGGVVVAFARFGGM